MNRRNILVGAVLLSGFLMASHADAFSVFVCNGNPVTWEDPFQMVQNTFSIPVGSTTESSVNNAIGRWNGVQGMANMVSKSPFTTGGNTITNDDGQNDVATTARANIGGNNGLTLLIHSLCVFSSSWEEADVLVANDLSFGAVGETSLATSGRLTFIHEFGHAHGLAHSQGFNHMRATQPRPLVGGPGETVDVLPDDARGGRFLYPNGNQEVNVFASAHRRTSKDKIVLNNAGTVTSCSSGGGTITLNATVGNNGTVNVTQTERWWVSTSAQAHSGGIPIFQSNNSTFPANTVITRQVTFKMPALPVGTFFLFHGVDQVGNESRQDDNSVREGLTINVIDC